MLRDWRNGRRQNENDNGGCKFVTGFGADGIGGLFVLEPEQLLLPNIIRALLPQRTTWRTRRLSETKPARSAKRPARATWVPAFAFKKSAFVRLNAASKTVCGVPMDAAIKRCRLALIRELP